VLNYIVNFDGLILGNLLVVAFKLIVVEIVFNQKDIKDNGELYVTRFLIN
jgi:hypothetical protein